MIKPEVDASSGSLPISDHNDGEIVSALAAPASASNSAPAPAPAPVPVPTPAPACDPGRNW